MIENAIVLLQTFIPSCCEASTAARSKSSFGKSESWQVEDSAGVAEVGGVVVVVVQLYPNSSSSSEVPEKCRICRAGHLKASDVESRASAATTTEVVTRRRTRRQLAEPRDWRRLPAVEVARIAPPRIRLMLNTEASGVPPLIGQDHDYGHHNHHDHR